MEERSGTTLGNHPPPGNGLHEEDAAAWSHGNAHDDDVVAVDAPREDPFGDAVLSHHEHLAHLAYLIAGSADRAEAAVPDAYARLWSRFDRGRVAADGELRVLTREVVAQVRERSRRVRVTAAASEPGDGNHAAWSALQRLPIEQRSALVLHLVEGLSIEETADVLGDTPETVEARITTGLAELAEPLGATGSDGLDG